jgi:hypothetical protein
MEQPGGHCNSVPVRTCSVNYVARIWIGTIAVRNKSLLTPFAGQPLFVLIMPSETIKAYLKTKVMF